MKINLFALFVLFTSYCFSQSVNDYQGIIVPLKYDFQKTDNQYRLQTMTKMNLQKAGFQTFYATEQISTNITDRCGLLYVDVQKENAFMVTKLFIVFKDCYGKEVYKSPMGKSREKEFETAYLDALNQAFVSVYGLDYKYNGNTSYSSNSGVVSPSTPIASAPVAPTTPAAAQIKIAAPVPVIVAPAAVVAATTPTNESYSNTKSANVLYAQPTSYGYQLIDNEPKVVMKIYKTSNPASYMAKKGEIQGVVVSKSNQWFFEYYKNDTLVSEKIDVKF